MDGVAALQKEDADVREWFFEVLAHHHAALCDKLRETIDLADRWCKSGEQSDFDALEDYLENLLPNEAILVRFTYRCRLPLQAA